MGYFGEGGGPFFGFVAVAWLGRARGSSFFGDNSREYAFVCDGGGDGGDCGGVVMIAVVEVMVVFVVVWR